MTSWITCQLGAREHYAIPRALHHSGLLHTAITDAWVTPQSQLRRLPGAGGSALCDRYHADLENANIYAFSQSLLAFELGQRFCRSDGWTSVIARNHWFQRHALRVLKAIENQFPAGDRPTLFSYSYTALSLFQYAKQRGWRTVLGQIDPGLTEETQVSQLQSCYEHQYPSSWKAAPKRYWQDWKQECQLADRILVNSAWSQSAIRDIGISKDKVEIVPLAYSSTRERSFIRQYPDSFSRSRPLRVLFLGQIILRKGIAAVLEALPFLRNASIEIWLVGSTELTLPADLRDHPQLKWIGPVSRSQVHQYYQQADVFLFPTHSDGFGLTQLEAQFWHLPIIASAHCGEVVTPGCNGLVLPEVSGAAIAQALFSCYKRPNQLQQWSEHTVDMSCYSLNQLTKTLQTSAHVLV